jgi:Alkyl sulfatase dimerisation
VDTAVSTHIARFPNCRRSEAAEYAANLATFSSVGRVRIISVGRRRMSRRERLGLGRLRPPRLPIPPAGAQQRIGQSLLDAIVRQTFTAMNDGAPPHVDIVRRVKLPETASPRLKPVYDEAEFIVRNVIRYYGGWWSGRPSELKPAQREPLACEIDTLAGGAGVLLRRARELAAAGEMRLACHLADYALEAAPEDPAIREGCCRAL